MPRSYFQVLVFLALDLQHHRQARQQVGLGAHQVLELAQRDVRRVEVLRVRPEAHDGAGALSLIFSLFSFWLSSPPSKAMVCLCAVAEDGDFAALRQRVGDRHADAVQAAGDVVHAVARARELAAGVQHRERHLDRGLLLHRVHVDRNAAALVLDLDRAVLEHAHGDLLAEAGERLVDRVVDRLLHDVQGMDRVRVHARHAPHGLQALQGLDRGCVVNLLFCHVFSFSSVLRALRICSRAPSGLPEGRELRGADPSRRARPGVCTARLRPRRRSRLPVQRDEAEVPQGQLEVRGVVRCSGRAAPPSALSAFIRWRRIDPQRRPPRNPAPRGASAGRCGACARRPAAHRETQAPDRGHPVLSCPARRRRREAVRSSCRNQGSVTDS